MELKHLSNITARHDAKQDLIEYVGLALLQNNQVAHDDEGAQIEIPSGSAVTYVMRTYGCDTKDGVVTMIVVYYTRKDKVYKLIESVCYDLPKAAHLWGMDDYRD